MIAPFMAKIKTFLKKGALNVITRQLGIANTPFAEIAYVKSRGGCGFVLLKHRKSKEVCTVT